VTGHLAVTGAITGLVGGAGLAVLVSAARRRRACLVERVAPYLGTPAPPSELLTGGSGAPSWTGELLPSLGRALQSAAGGRASLARRLERAGTDDTVDHFRQQQVVWAAVGFLTGVALLVVRAGGGLGVPPLSLAGLTLLLTVGGPGARGAVLDRRIRLRESEIAADLPAVAELLALAVTAGEAPAGALERVAGLSGGPLAEELRRALAALRAGATLTDALAETARRTEVSALARFADGMRVAIARGTPLAEVLQAQAADAREAGKRALLEAGGRKEIAMLIPVVFLILPVTILFALFPGAVTLSTLTH
jgi:tight adherence protein C